MISHSGRKRAAIIKTKMATTTRDPDHEYDSLLTSCRESFAWAGAGPFFQTDATGLWELYLKNLPAQERQFHTCHCCRRFIGAYGDLVTIDAGGHTTPAMWSPNVVGLYEASFSSMFHAVKAARVTSPFLSKEAVWGTPVTGDWTHLSVVPPSAIVYRERLLTAGQKIAAKKQDFITVSTALAEFTAPMLDQALRLLEADTLARSEKFIGPAKWLRALHDRPKGRLSENVLWRAIALAPDGYCHPKSSVLGPLLTDIAAGKPFDEIKRSFDAMLSPYRYQRPQAPPAAGNIKAAEAIVEKLGLTRSLERRFARLEEVPKSWEPRAIEAKPVAGGVFAHLKAKDSAGAIKPVELPEAVMTAEKFIAKVLPTAEKMEFLVPSRGNFIAMLTAEHADAPIIHKWGNPFSIYVYINGSDASQWKLRSGCWTPVTALVRMPSMWGDRPMEQLGDGYIIALEGAADIRDSGNALFPETLIGDLHGARATVEAYSRTAKIGGRETASVCGYSLRKEGGQIRLRVFSSGYWSSYKIDRWD
jgi:hypothetical protein